MIDIKKTGIIILAAGVSSRLGQPKQLLHYGDKNLLEHTIEAAENVGSGIVVVILGAHYALIADAIRHKGCEIVHNSCWEEGMSSSIRAGLSALIQLHEDLEAVILTVCDQPYLTASVLKTLLDTADTSGKNIVASVYSRAFGTPVLFSRLYFDSLMELKGAEGAKVLLKKFQDDVALAPFEKGEIDIDTKEDYNKLG